MSASHLDIDFFRKLAGVSEDALLAAVTKLAVEKDTTSVLNFAKVLAEIGTTGGMFDKGKSIDIESLKIKDTSFTWAIAKSLAPLDDREFQSNSLNQEQAEILSLALQTIDKHHARSELLAQFAFDLTSTGRDPKVFEQITQMGADLMVEHKTRSLDAFKNVNAMLEALGHGNTVAALAFLPTLTTDKVVEVIHELEGGTQDSRTNLFIGSKGLLRATGSMAEMQRSGGVLDFLSALDDRIGSETVAERSPRSQRLLDHRVGAEAVGGARARLIAFHLEKCIAKSTPWDADQVRALAGPGGFDPDQSMMTKKLINASASWEPKAYNALVDASLRAHCAPTLELCHPILGTLSSDGRNRAMIGKAIEQGNYTDLVHGCNSDDYPCIVERFKDTLKVMTDNGHNHYEAAKVNGKPTPSMHFLARTERKDRAQKQIGLLELGLSPKLKDDRGWVPLSHVKGEESKSQWVSVERSFAARSKAHDVLAELDLDPGGETAGPTP